MQSFIKGKRILVTGGTGSFGHQIADTLLTLGPAEIRLFSRDENKQYHMRNEYDSPLLRYEIGDVRDYERTLQVMKGIDLVFHAAALKHVPQCEEFPLEAVKTNILGAHNVVRAASESGVEAVVAVSTDKAVKPVNAMGMSKALQEKIMLAANHYSKTRFVCVRYGNVINSRGSVIPRFIELIRQGKPLPITDVHMTRFLLSLPQAIELVLKAAQEGQGGEIFVKKMPACKITDLAEAVGEEIAKKKNYPTKVVGVRPGEKIHEVLVSEEEMHRAVEVADYFVIHPPGQLKAPKLLREWGEYASNTTTQLGAAEIRKIVRELG